MDWFKDRWSKLINDELGLNLFFLSLGLYISLVGIVVLADNRLPLKGVVLPPEFPLFYSLPRGIEQLGTINDVWYLTLGMGILFLFNSWLILLLIKKWHVLAYVLLWVTILSISMLEYSLIRIYLLVN